MTAVVPSDRADAYQVKIFNGAEECYIYDSLVPEYQLKVKVIKPEYTVTDPNEAPNCRKTLKTLQVENMRSQGHGTHMNLEKKKPKARKKK